MADLSKETNKRISQRFLNAGFDNAGLNKSLKDEFAELFALEGIEFDLLPRLKRVSKENAISITTDLTKEYEKLKRRAKYVLEILKDVFNLFILNPTAYDDLIQQITAEYKTLTDTPVSKKVQQRDMESFYSTQLVLLDYKLKNVMKNEDAILAFLRKQ